MKKKKEDRNNFISKNSVAASPVPRLNYQENVFY